ncbi:MAG: hypothetical protein AB9Q19_00210 [Candidatus Reddybacter sp.]
MTIGNGSGSGKIWHPRNGHRPRAFETPSTKTVPEELWNEIIKETPFPKRLGQPDEFAALVWDICCNKMLNGEVIRLDTSLRMFNQ